MRMVLRAGACLLTTACGVSVAQDLSGLTGTIGIEADTVTRQGHMAGCSLNYRAAVQDFAYRQGALVGVSGSFNLNLIRQENKKSVGALLKVGVKQMLPPGQNEAPAFAYLASQNGSTAKNVVAHDISDTPGYRVFAIKVDKDLLGLVDDMLDGEPVTLHYSRTATGLDVKVPLDLRVLDSKAGPKGIEPIRGDNALNTLRGCFQRLAQELR